MVREGGAKGEEGGHGAGGALTGVVEAQLPGRGAVGVAGGAEHGQAGLQGSTQGQDPGEGPLGAPRRGGEVAVPLGDGQVAGRQLEGHRRLRDGADRADAAHAVAPCGAAGLREDVGGVWGGER